LAFLLFIFVGMDSPIIISERNRPFWQIPIAALFLTATFTILCAFILQFFIYNETISYIARFVYYTLYLLPFGLGFCTQKRIHIDIKNSRFRPTVEIGNFKFGKWKTIRNYDYVSVFYDPSKQVSDQFEVNLWFDRNKHFELYARNNFEDAMLIAYNLSEELKIDLLDATIKNDYSWIDKEELKQKANEQTS